MSEVRRNRRLGWLPQPLTLAVLLMMALALTGCTVRLIGDYDDTLDKGVTDLQQRAELYFAKLRSTPATPYDQSFHDDISSRIAVLKSRASSLPMYSIIAQQIDILKTQFGQFQTLDQITPRPITGDIVTPAESAVDVSIESILKLELALKRGATPPG
jgi:hypothetical protein